MPPEPRARSQMVWGGPAPELEAGTDVGIRGKDFRRKVTHREIVDGVERVWTKKALRGILPWISPSSACWKGAMGMYDGLDSRCER